MDSVNGCRAVFVDADRVAALRQCVVAVLAALAESGARLLTKTNARVARVDLEIIDFMIIYQLVDKIRQVAGIPSAGHR